MKTALPPHAPAMHKGLLIVIDGIDGSGKTLQSSLLCDRLRDLGHRVETPSFPRYDKESSYFVRKLLRGGFEDQGGAQPHIASMMYAFDRMDAAAELREHLDRGDILVSNRYTSSNVGHQGGRIENLKERKAYYAWLDHFEHDQLRIPRPDLVLYLHVSVDTALTMIHQRYLEEQRASKDLYDTRDHLLKAYQSYNEAASLFPYWRTVECMEGNAFLPPDVIAERIWQEIAPVLTEHSQSMDQAASKIRATGA